MPTARRLLVDPGALLACMAYVDTLLDRTGRQIPPGQRGPIDPRLRPPHERLGLDAEAWVASGRARLPGHRGARRLCASAGAPWMETGIWM